MAVKLSERLNKITDPVEQRTLYDLFSRFMNNDATNTLKDVVFADGSGITDSNGYIVWLEGNTIPTAAGAGYAPGCEFILSNASLGQCPKWVNLGSATSCAFYPVGPVMGYGCAFAGGPVDLTDDADETYVALPGVIQQTDYCFASKCVTAGADQFKAVVPTSGKDSLLIDMAMGGNPTDSMDAYYAGFRNLCTPTHDIVFAGEYAAVTGDDATVAITITGVLATDMAFVTPLTTDDTDTINLVVCTADTLTITVSTDPEVAHSYSYMILRKRGTFKPSHYVAYAGQYTAVTGDTTAVAITVTGALATDIAIVQCYDSDDDDCFVEAAIASADTLTMEVTNDPVTDHSWSYLILRAY